MLLLCCASICLAKVESSQWNRLMPNGIGDVYPGMPVQELLSKRPRLESGTRCWDCFDYPGFFLLCKWVNDPNNPKKIDMSKNARAIPVHHLKEKIGIPLFETIHYYFSSPLISWIEIEGFVDTRKEIEEYPQKRDELIVDLLRKWGVPDAAHAGVYSYDRYLTIEMVWHMQGAMVELKLPLEVEGYFKAKSMSDKLAARLFGVYGAPVLLRITDVEQTKAAQRKRKPTSGDYRIADAKEIESLLGRTTYYRTLRQSMEKSD